MSALNLLVEGFLFLLFMILQALFINGIKAAAEGVVEERPDGTKKFLGMVFFPIAYNITRTKKVKSYYNKETLYDEIGRLYAKYSTKGIAFPATVMNLEFVLDNCIEGWVKLASAENEYAMVEQFAKFIKEREGIDYCFHGPANAIQFFKTYEDPVYPAIIRKPFIECIKCMSSFWGSLTFWPVVVLLMGFHWWQIPMFIVDVIILVYLNYFYYKKLLR